MTEWYQAKILRLCELNNVEERDDIVIDIKIKFNSLNYSDRRQIARNLDYEPLFLQLPLTNILDDYDRNVRIIEQIFDILYIMSSVLEGGEIYLKYPVEILAMLNNSHHIIRKHVISELVPVSHHNQKRFQLLDETALLISIINSIGDDDFEIAKCAMLIVKNAGMAPNDSFLFKDEFLRAFAKLLQKNDTVSFRVYDVIVFIAKLSRKNLEMWSQSGLLNGLINFLDNEDILLQLNALTVLSELTIFEEGISYLEQQGVLNKLAQKIAQANKNPLSHLLIPGLMKFFGNIARHWPNELFSKYPVVISALFEVFDRVVIGNEDVLKTALDTLGLVSASVEGKYALQALGDAMPSALKKIAEIVQRMPTSLRIHGLYCLALILEVKSNEQDNRILSLTKLWFDSLCDDPLDMIVSICRQPFEDIKTAGMKVLMQISSQVWGQEYISIHPGLVEFLLDRNIESSRECICIKYEIVKCLSQAEPNIFDWDTIRKFKQFVDEGRYCRRSVCY
ncbi:hypothetical protein ACFW04_000261 [Cataglyphis niger]